MAYRSGRVVGRILSITPLLPSSIARAVAGLDQPIAPKKQINIVGQSDEK